MMPRRERADAQARIVAEEDAYAAEAGRLVDLRARRGARCPRWRRGRRLRRAPSGRPSRSQAASRSTSASSSTSPRATMRNIGSAAPVAKPPDARHAPADDAVGRRRHLGACAATSVRGVGLRPGPFRLRRAFSPSWAATSCASAVRAACSRWSSVGLSHDNRRLQRLGALKGVVPLQDARFGLHDRRSAWAMAAVERAMRGIVLGDLRVERIGYQAWPARRPSSRASPSSASTSVTRRPSTSGPTRISSRATSEPVASTVSVKSAGRDARHGHRRRRAASSACASAAALLGAGPVGFGRRAAHEVRQTIAPAAASTPPIRNFLMIDSLRLFIVCWKPLAGADTG